MSRSKLIRALLAAASLLGAVPLMAQNAPAPGPAFPYGRYAIAPAAGAAPDTTGLVVEFTPGLLSVFQGGRDAGSHGLNIEGTRFEVYEFEGQCSGDKPIIGSYTWIIEGGVLRFELIADECTSRVREIQEIRLVKFR